MLTAWWHRRRRRIECHRRYGDACPHLERHAARWTVPFQHQAPTTPRPEDETGTPDQDT